MTTKLANKNEKKTNLRTRLVPGILLIVAGLTILLLFARNIEPVPIGAKSMPFGLFHPGF